jgi:aspartyl-tRNA(Asn)/glutamyl-tRNA(Gln) amidotransferase subunit A
MKLTDLSLVEAQKGLKERKFSAVELVQEHLQAMADHRALNAYITETPELALAQAKKADERLQKDKGGVLEGLPIAVKDLFCTKGVKTTAGSKILDGFVPPYESTVTQNLWDEGAIMLGKTNMDEFAMGSSNLTSAFGPVISPWKRQNDSKQLVPGGSSGGSAAAVAAKIALAATASDTGGSIRQPASFCGLVGIKPTYGLCSRWGMVAFSSSMDQAGPLTRTVADAALMLQVMASHDSKDATSLKAPSYDYTKGLTGNCKGLRVGIPKEYRVDGMDPKIERLWDKGREWLKAQGAEIKEVSLPHTQQALPVYYILAPAEASSNLARYDGVRYGLRVPGETIDELYENTRGEGFGAEVKRRILIGTYVLSAGYYDAYYIKAQKVRTLITQDFEKAFQGVDVLLTPTTPTDAFAIDEKPTDAVTMYLNDIFTVTANLAGLPGISVPVGLSAHGLPLGLQLIGPKFSEERLLCAAKALETAADFADQVKNLGKK